MPGPAPERLLRALLAAAVALPAVIVVPGTEGGVAFTLYREPKLAALGLLGWLFVLVFLALRVPGPGLGGLGRALRSPYIVLFLAFLLYGGVSRAWVRVPENHRYEWSQYLLLFVLTVLLDAWSREAKGVRRLVRAGLVASLVPVVVVGYLQLAGAFPYLVPIDPGYGVRHASFLGYKNPAALAVAGHLFLLAGAVLAVLRSKRPWPVRVLAATYGAAVVLYLVTLQSRTAMIATAGAGALVALLYVARHRRLPGGRGALALLVAGAVCVGAVVLAAPESRARLASIGGFLSSPSSLLDSDRGVYLRNTLAMVADRPFGVGLGDWQTWYPVYRRVDRYRAFDETFQVRRAHGDHVQTLGELGWIGLALWWALLAAAVAAPLRRFQRRGRLRDLLLVGQLAFFILAMAGDYVVELPYLKLQLFLVCFLAVAPGPDEDGGRTGVPAPGGMSRGGRRGRALAVVVVTGVGLLQAVWFAGLGWRSVAAARLEVSYRATKAVDSPAGPARRSRLGERFTAGDGPGACWSAGHAKTFYRAHLVLAHDAAVRGETERALQALRRALDLHPFHPGAFALCAEILRQARPETARRCADLHDYVLHEATGGFERTYPELLSR